MKFIPGGSTKLVRADTTALTGDLVRPRADRTSIKADISRLTADINTMRGDFRGKRDPRIVRTVWIDDIEEQTNGLPNGLIPAPYKNLIFYDWYAHGSVAGNPSAPPPAGLAGFPSFAPPPTWSATTSWGQFYWKAGATYQPNTTLYVRNFLMLLHYAAGGWVLVQHYIDPAFDIYGAHYAADFAGNSGIPMVVTKMPDGSFAMPAPPVDFSQGADMFAYNCHFYPLNRATWTGAIDGAIMAYEVRKDNPLAQIIATAGIDWWKNMGAVFPDNTGGGGSNWVEAPDDPDVWAPIYCTGMTTAQILADPPPFLTLGSLSVA